MKIHRTCRPRGWRLIPPALALALIALLAPVGTGQPASQSSGDPQAPDAQDQGLRIDFLEGPGTGALGREAEVDLGEGYRFAGASDTQKIMEAFGNPISGNELGYLDRADVTWFVVFEFSDIGYVKDEEKDELDADALLDTLREGNERGNEERRRRGWPTLEITGWEQPPHYDAQTHNLEWAPRLQSEDGSYVINYNTRLLGRHGVMEVTLVVDTEKLETTLPTFKEILRGFRFTPGNTYAEFRKGDKIAKYGLAALVAGGVAAVAFKTGFLAKFWKFLVVGVLAVAGFFRKMLARLFGWGPETAKDDTRSGEKRTDDA